MKIKIPTINNEEIEFTAEPDKACILLGENGSGKTRLSIYLAEEINKINKRIHDLKNEIQQLEININTEEEKIQKEIMENFKGYIENRYKVDNEELDTYELVEWGIHNNLFDIITPKKGGTILKPQGISIENIPGRAGIAGIEEIQYVEKRLKPPIPSINVDYAKLAHDLRTDNKAVEKYIHAKREEYRTQINSNNKKIEYHTPILENTHRISAHRGLKLNTDLPPKKKEEADRALSQSNSQFQNNQNITSLQNDFDTLITALISEEAEVGAKHLQDIRNTHNDKQSPPETSLSKLISYWNKIMPHRKIDINGLKISVSNTTNKNNDNDTSYNPSDMSDGERNIFYILGQCFLAPENSFLIIDEPELHINKSLMIEFWEHIQAERQDCCFLFVTHDIDFANSFTCDKYILKEYQHPEKWDIISLSDTDDNDIPEDIKIKILGSRKPILFIEGDEDSWDKLIYEQVYSDYRIIPVDPCEEVKKFTKTFNKNRGLHYIHCKGIIDKDDLDETEVIKLQEKGIYSLSVNSIENIFLIPEICEYMYKQENSEYNKEDVTQAIINFIKKHEHKMIHSWTMKEVKTAMEKYTQDIKNTSTKKLENFSDITIKVSKLYKDALSKMESLTNSSNPNLTEILKTYRNKGLYKTILADKNALNAKNIDIKIRSLLSDGDFIKLLKKHLPEIE